MNKSPEEYFKEQNFSAEAVEKGSFTPAEQAFMDKYLGVDSAAVLAQIGIEAPVAAGPAAPAGAEQAAETRTPPPAPGAEASAPMADLHEAMTAEEPLEDMMRAAGELQMVGFFIGSQEFTIPTVAVQEVIRSMPLAKLPAAPQFVAGVINLRGRVTPLIHLRDILEVNSPRQGEDKFIIVCRRKGFQVGLIIERVHTMYRVPQQDIDWSIEAHVGINADFIAGLLKLREQLVAIVSVDRVIEGILK
ncbi:chemotaxis protein CheW [Desulfovibrio sp. OttesenSCG-928-A18]|nr:chemotaxis protein CheW [Desulfovibrio sp. OttesenSCG-928-A18]